MHTKNQIHEVRLKVENMIGDKEAHLLCSLSSFACRMSMTRTALVKFLLIGEPSTKNYVKVRPLRELIETVIKANLNNLLKKNKITTKGKDLILFRDFSPEKKTASKVEHVYLTGPLKN